MPLTVAQVVGLPQLGLTLHTDLAPTDRVVRWVAVSELLDPTPYLDGGDLLLTVGMSIVDEPGAARDYVGRLVAADVAALGIGIGLTHEAVPGSILTAAENAGLPVLEVPQAVPFVAVSKAVSRVLAAEEYAESTASFDCQRRLLRAALGQSPGGAARLESVIARHVGGFVVHVSATGEVLASSPRSAAGRLADVAVEIDRLRSSGILGSASISTATEHIVILPIGVKAAPEGFLVVGSPRPLKAADQAVMNLAVSLLSWDSPRPALPGGGLDPWRRLLVDSARDSGLSAVRLAAIGLAALTPDQAVAVVIRGVGEEQVPTAVVTTANSMAGGVFCRGHSTEVIGFAPAPGGGDVAGELDEIATLPGVWSIGVSCVLDLTDAVNVRQAQDQAERAAALGAGMHRYGDEPARGMASLVDAATAAAWARGYLGELLEASEAQELTDTLRAWLAQHGQVDAAAQSLGIHRHTVRHRLRRAEAVLGRRLDDPGVRADLWFALAACDMPGGRGSPTPGPERRRRRPAAPGEPPLR